MDGTNVRFIQKSVRSVVLLFHCSWVPEENQRLRELRTQAADCGPHPFFM